MFNRKKITKSNTPSFLFHCSPSLGALDSWLPVLQKLKNKIPSAKFIFIASQKGVIDQINEESELIKISRDIFDLIIFRSDSELLLHTNSFKDAKKLNRNTKLKIFNYPRRLFNKLKLKIFSELVHSLYKSYLEIIHPKNIFDISSLENNKHISLLCVSELRKSYFKDFYDVSVNSANYSILHGTGIQGIETYSTAGIRDETRQLNTINTNAYLFSHYEVDFYQDYYKLNNKQIKVYGVPKHQKKWLEIFSNTAYTNHRKYILIISRPVNEHMPIDRRVEFLKIIKKIAIKFELYIVVKPHPTELSTKLYKEVFESGNDHIQWHLSERHPLWLAKNSEFAISYYSGVPLDLLHLGVPTIELSNFVGIKHDDHKESLRSSMGEAVRCYRYLNLVLGASTYDEMEKHVSRIFNDRDKVMEELMSNYRAIFPVKDNINNLISDEIKDAFVELVAFKK